MIKVRVVNGYPYEGRKYQLYAVTEKGNYSKVIENKRDMVHSWDMIDLSEWTLNPSNNF